MSNWTKQDAYLTGMTGKYRNSNVEGESNLNNRYNNYGNAYRGGMNGATYLEKPHYNNPNNLMHNNVGDKVIDISQLPTKLFINSAIRDFTAMPEPYKYYIKFNAKLPTKEKVSIHVDNNEYFYYNYTSGDRSIVIERSFKNINQIAVDVVILPVYINFKTNDDGMYVPTGSQLSKTYRYIILKIPELSNCRKFSNMDTVTDDTFILKFDKDSGGRNMCWIPIHDSNSFFNSNLKNINRLSIELFDDKGNGLCTTLDGHNYDFYKEYRQLIDKLKKLHPDSEEALKYAPKLKCLREIIEHIYMEIHFTMYIVEPTINTLPKFQRN